mmetsp:Transcript_35699/g.70333  ORF Transcript_35699/g.70333 Transcript_35699/m.70333 type:complete len:321 (-) Transcript_35699:196-1158(-)
MGELEEREALLLVSLLRVWICIRERDRGLLEEHSLEESGRREREELGGVGKVGQRGSRMTRTRAGEEEVGEEEEKASPCKKREKRGKETFHERSSIDTARCSSTSRKRGAKEEEEEGCLEERGTAASLSARQIDQDEQPNSGAQPVGSESIQACASTLKEKLNSRSESKGSADFLVRLFRHFSFSSPSGGKTLKEMNDGRDCSDTPDEVLTRRRKPNGLEQESGRSRPRQSVPAEDFGAVQQGPRFSESMGETQKENQAKNEEVDHHSDRRFQSKGVQPELLSEEKGKGPESQRVEALLEIQKFLVREGAYAYSGETLEA